MSFGDNERDRGLNAEDKAFIDQVRSISRDFGLPFTFSINAVVHNGALIAYDPYASYQKVFDTTRNLETARCFLEGYARGKSNGREEGRRSIQAELRSLMGIEEDNGTLYISR